MPCVPILQHLDDLREARNDETARDRHHFARLGNDLHVVRKMLRVCAMSGDSRGCGPHEDYVVADSAANRVALALHFHFEGEFPLPAG